MNPKQDDQFYGTARAQEVGFSDFVAEQLRRQGYAVVNDILTPKEIADYSQRVDAVYKQQEVDFGQVDLERIKEQNLARCLLAYDPAFAGLACHPTILGLVGHILGSYFILHLQNSIIVHPNITHHQSSWHRDLPYQEYTSSKPLALNAFVCLSEFSPKTGGTMFLPFSHREEKLPSKDYLNTFAVQPTIAAGSCILFDSMVFHRAGNNTASIIRRGINHVYTAGILRQQIDLPSVLAVRQPTLHGRILADPAQRVLFGYEASTARSVDEFRQRRLQKA